MLPAAASRSARAPSSTQVTSETAAVPGEEYRRANSFRICVKLETKLLTLAASNSDAAYVKLPTRPAATSVTVADRSNLAVVQPPLSGA